MAEFIHERHKLPTSLSKPRELILACEPLRSNVNLSRIARTAGCCGIDRILCCGTAKVTRKIARDGADHIKLEVHRTLAGQLPKLKSEGYHLVGLEQTSESTSLFDFHFQRKTALIVGNERRGIGEEVLAQLDAVVEIPVYGLPYSHNVATAAAMAMYEYCRQFPDG